ncbi:MAG TPA: ribonuclease H-like domain-containing protein [Pirellulales bacterium]|nr:ribonuclease H-like domain-containing protein [Pirellulales bacterium]
MSDYDFELDTTGVSLLDDDIDPATTGNSAPSESQAAKTATHKSRGNAPLYFDIETVPDVEREHLFGLDPVPPVPAESDLSACPDVAQVAAGTANDIKAALRKIVAPSAWLDKLAETERSGKDRSGVHELIAAAREVRQRAIEAQADRIKLLSTTPEFCKIAAIGWAVGNEVPCSLVLGEGDITERDLLEAFWERAGDGGQLVCFNGLGFDLPVIFVRSAILGVPSSRSLDMKPWGRDVLDVYFGRFGSRGSSGKDRPARLKDLARLYGIDVPAEGVDGSQVHELMQTDPAKVGEYVRSDVEVLRSLHRKLSGYFWV